jgi:hypothetical protein
MQTGLQSFIENKKLVDSLPRQGEEATKQGLILPILQYLGWNPFDVQEVYPEFSVQNGRVDYSLRVNNLNKVFVEVKKLGEDLDRHQEQLLQYAFKHGVKLAILTNGTIWWFYLPLHEGSWEQRRFYTIDMHSQHSADIVDKLLSFLAKNAVMTGQAVINAESIYTSRQRKEVIEQTLPKAWRKLLSESDESLTDTVAQAVEKLCGYKPDAAIVVDFLKKISGNASLLSTPKPIQINKIEQESAKPAEAKETSPTKEVVSAVTNSKPQLLRFENKEYKVTDWVSLLKTFMQVVAEKHPDELSKLTTLVGKQRPYFTTDDSLLRKANRIPNSPIFHETHFRVCWGIIFGNKSRFVVT